jgi:hypothetical protein
LVRVLSSSSELEGDATNDELIGSTGFDALFWYGVLGNFLDAIAASISAQRTPLVRTTREFEVFVFLSAMSESEDSSETNRTRIFTLADWMSCSASTCLASDMIGMVDEWK